MRRAAPCFQLVIAYHSEHPYEMTRARLDRRRRVASNPLPLNCLTASGIAGTTEGAIALTSNMTARPGVQDDFLQMLVNDKTTVNVFLVNGIRLTGQLAAFDQFAVL